MIAKTDKIFISADLWDKWGSDVQNSLLEFANLTIFAKFDGKWKYQDVPWNLFENINEKK